jgi:hypothetical protein
MTNTIKWKYEGTDIYFISTEANFERHKLHNAVGLNLTNPKIKIIENEPTTNSPVTTTPCRNCDSSAKVKSTVPVDNQTNQPTGEETSGLLDVSDVLDITNTPFNFTTDADLPGDLG